MIKAVIFDLDGTLVNSLEDLATSTNYALKVFGYPTHETEKYKYFVGDGMPKLIERVLPVAADEKLKKQVLDCFMEHYRAHYVDKTTVYEGIKPLLASLNDLEIKLAVLSNKAQEMAETVVLKLLPKRFSIIYGKQEGFPTKPDIQLTLKLLNELNVKPNECLFVGDSGMDMLAAKKAGCLAVGVLWGFRTENELLECGADYIFNVPQDIYNLVKEVNNAN